MNRHKLFVHSPSYSVSLEPILTGVLSGKPSQRLVSPVLLMGLPWWLSGDPPAMQETCVLPLGWDDPLEKGMATHSSILAWRIPWTEEPGRL